MDAAHRLHALDNLRAAMMWLGIVLHVSAQHMVGPSPLPWRDPATSPVADLLIAFIHAFRMPVFFVLAGFFMALLVARRGAAATLAHRMKRIALPFVVFWPPVFVALAVLVMAFAHRATRGTWGLDPALPPPRPGVPLVNTMHLWFLYLLIWFSLLTYAALRLAPVLPQAVRRGVGALFGRLGRAAWGPLVLALPLALAGAGSPMGILAPTGSFLPPWQEWLHNGVFFVFGWFMFAHQTELFAHYVRRWGWYALAGLALFFAAGALTGPPHARLPDNHRALVAYVYGSASWCWSFALIGLFLRALPQRHRVLGYLSDSSYWVYIVHMIGTIGVGALLVAEPWPALVKMGVNIALTSALALASYQLAVRHTWVGRLLNGQRAAAPGGGVTATAHVVAR